MNYLQSSSYSGQRETLPMAWLPVVFGLMVISIESTVLMGGANTGRWLLDVCHALWGQGDGPHFEEAHFLLRKVGHFTGYGTLALLFRRGWYRSVRSFTMYARSQVRHLAAGLAVFSTFVIACLDEWHQSYLPGRTSSFRDVMIDTGGAIVFNTVMLVMFARRRKALLESRAY